MKAPVMVLGAGGMLGQELVPRLQQKLDEAGLATFTKTELDITDGVSLSKTINGVRPRTVINCAAFTDVDGCESQVDLAMNVNAKAPSDLAKLCKAIAATLVHISTDFVFDGRSRRAYVPDSPGNPLSVYGGTKWEGEKAIRESGCRHLIVRTSWLFGAFGRNFVEAILKRAESGQPLTVVDDQTGRPTHAGDLADALIRLIEKDATGTFHFANAGACTWNDFAKEIVAAAKLRVSVAAMSSAELNRPATRPMYSVLDTAAYERLTGHRPRPWQDALTDYMNERLQPGSFALRQAIAKTSS